jgi:hypothetical protein
MDRLRFLSLGAVALASPRGALAALTAPRFRSRPDLDPPVVHVLQARTDTPGLIFVANTNGAGQPGPMILTGDGELVWFEARPGKTVMNFASHAYENTRVLAWWEGTLNGGSGSGEYVLLDTHYKELTRIRAGNGLTADLHEFSITPQGTAIITAYDQNGGLLDSLVQEIDVATGELVFEWRASGHIALDESYVTAPVSGPYDFAHLNAAALDRDGNFLISSRHTWTIYKVDRTTGAVIWRLGGKKSDFALGDGVAFHWQHHTRRHADDTLSIFDNGAGPVQSEAYSRGIRLKLDESAGTATLVQELAHPERLLASAMGSMEPLDDGGSFVGWGSVPRFSEFAPDGTLRFDAGYPGGGFTYRALRRAWTATPTAPPALVVSQGSGWVSWNGATAVAKWRLHAGAVKTRLAPAGVVEKKSFETRLRLPAGVGWIRADALDAKGRVLGSSRVVRA